VGRTILALSVLALCAAPAGCGRGDAERDARRTVERFHAAVERGDGEAACRELSEEAASKLEQQEQRPCEQAVLTLELSGGRVVEARVFQTSASADLSEGGTDFLDDTSQGWKLTAVGCTPLPGQPYNCELEI
jgi:hypothetical protein